MAVVNCFRPVANYAQVDTPVVDERETRLSITDYNNDVHFFARSNSVRGSYFTRCISAFYGAYSLTIVHVIKFEIMCTATDYIPDFMSDTWAVSDAENSFLNHRGAFPCMRALYGKIKCRRDRRISGRGFLLLVLSLYKGS
ncbi:hypothetical protein TcasGA2_TC008943 [Tribolium castaneum]|uniref:Uncharacterized protein n=1 Tax=Tribolium castaneum TaxID=7070 RepID=D6WQB1_TRICA|nr:hypothetical protein TcasGA2_TC008943 [Tribolium castaneum]